MTQLAKPSGAQDGVSSPSGCPAKNFDTQRIPSLQPLVDEPGAAAVAGARAERPGVQVATKSTRSQKREKEHEAPHLVPRRRQVRRHLLASSYWTRSKGVHTLCPNPDGNR